MSEAIDNHPQDTVDQRQSRDNARLRKVATKHATIFLMAMTLWGTSDLWASLSDLWIASLVASLNAIFAGYVIAFLAHEWGHFSGARFSGAVSPVAKDLPAFFMFNFHHDKNTTSQFLSMSMGGPIANWSLVVVFFFLLPLDTLSQCLLVATFLAIAVNVSVFEFPVINRVMYGAQSEETIAKRLQETGKTPRNIGIGAGIVAATLMVL